MNLDPAWYDHPDLEILPAGWGPDDELEVAELGDRVSTWFTNSLLANAYATERDRIWGVISNMVSAVALRTSRRGLDFPGEWTLEDITRGSL